MAELADALASGASDRKVVQVQPLFGAPEELSNKKRACSFFIRSDDGALASLRSKLASHQK